MCGIPLSELDLLLLLKMIHGLLVVTVVPYELIQKAGRIKGRGLQICKILAALVKSSL
jgi:hypothetical protein